MLVASADAIHGVKCFRTNRQIPRDEILPGTSELSNVEPIVKPKSSWKIHAIFQWQPCETEQSWASCDARS